ncbi:MAG: hypothetical protein J0I41_09125 [Filimonas sp.]|nr:hypothetical protein [Filimonas sp.]
MINSFTTYQLLGLNKMLSFKETFRQKMARPLSFKASLQNSFAPVSEEEISHFTSIFCDHQLADTDYDVIQKEAGNFKSPEDYIAQSQLDVILKSITYIIWTDRIVEGYFYAKVHDGILYRLLSRLEMLLKGEERI